MKYLKIKLLLLLAFIICIFFISCSENRSSYYGKEKVIELRAKKFFYSPGIITVNKGERVVIKLISEDVTHGLYLDGYDIELYASPGEVRTAMFTADKTGRFTFRCSMTCGELHPYMIGYLRVLPNYNFSLGAIGLIAIGGLFSFLLIRKKLDKKFFGILPPDSKFELTKYGWIRSILKSRWMPLAFILINLLIFTVIFIAGWVGGIGPGNYNFGIMIVWIVWWVLLMLLMVPFLARIWCGTCPLPVFGDWIQRGKIFGVRKGKLLGLNKKWPRKLRNMWLVNFLFLITTFFTAFFTTRPIYTFALLGLIVVSAIIISYVFEKRTFCKYLCPVGGFQGLYSNFALAEIRVKDPDICKKHTPKTCFVGNEAGYGCPWMETPFNMKRNTYCGMCFECFKSCPYDNMSLNIRPFGKDLIIDEKRGLDEAWKSFIMIGCAIIFYVIMQGPYGFLRDWANMKTIKGFLSYIGTSSALSLVILPAIFGLFILLSKVLARPSDTSFKKIYTNLSYALAPVGLSAWWAFSFGILLPNSSYVPHVLSDPYAYGWNLFGTAGVPWSPFLTGILPYLQMASIFAGVLFSLDIGYKLSKQTFEEHRQAVRGFIPLALFLILLGVALLWLFIG
jgi:hypothetical protein